jgi:hypothetical protein
MTTNIAQQVSTAPFSSPSSARDSNPAMHPDEVDITAALHMASLVAPYLFHSGRPTPPNPRLRPMAPCYSIAQGMYINTASIVVDLLWLAGHTNPSCSVSSGTCRPPLQMLRFLPCFGVAVSPNPTWTAWTTLQIAQPLAPLTLIQPVPGATVEIVRWIEKLLFACASMSLDSCYSVRWREIDSCFTFVKTSV